MGPLKPVCVFVKQESQVNGRREEFQQDVRLREPESKLGSQFV
jgi:hypothetical protein